MRSNKQVPYKKRKYSREEELRKRLLLLIGGAAVLAVLLVILVVTRGRTKVSGENGAAVSGSEQLAGGSAAVNTAVADGSAAGEGSAADSTAAADTASGESAAAGAEAESVAPTETPLPTAIPIDEQEMKIADLSGDWRLVLVNPRHRLPDDFDIEVAELSFAEDYYFDARAVDALDEMLYDCREAGCSPQVRACFRTMETQRGLYENKIQEWMDEEGYSREEAEEVAATIVAYPGTSEHQLGLSADIADVNYPKLNSSQEESPTQQWLMSHCQDYGFILRFPSGKSDLTGIIYEPWHYRYVGREVAAEIMERGICLEEYLAEQGVL